MKDVETILEGLLELVRLDMQLRKTGKETSERRQVEDAINSVSEVARANPGPF